MKQTGNKSTNSTIWRARGTPALSPKHKREWLANLIGADNDTRGHRTCDLGHPDCWRPLCVDVGEGTGHGLMTNHLSAHGAKCLAAHITSYWRAKGYSGIKVWSEPLKIEYGDAVPFMETHIVRSNMVNGYPPR